MTVPPNTLITINAPAIQINAEPVKLAVWYRADSDNLQFALGGYAEVDGNSGAVLYTLRSKPEIQPNVWQQTEIEVKALYTQVTPFIVLFNGDPTGSRTIYFDNLSVDQGQASDPGALVNSYQWQPNLWLLDADKGTAVIDNGKLILEKNEQQKASRFVAIYGQNQFPNRVTVEADIVKDFGESGSVTVWAGNGPSAFQADVPLWILPTGSAYTVRMSGVTTQNSGPMNIVIQIAGEDNERITVQGVRVYETGAN